MALLTEIVYSFEAIAFHDPEDGQYKPSVKVLINGEFFSWDVFELGFDEPRFAMPYAREIMREKIAMYKDLVGVEIKNLGR